MLRRSLYFFIIAIVAVAFGFTEISAGADSAAQMLFFIFIVLFMGALVLKLTISLGHEGARDSKTHKYTRGSFLIMIWMLTFFVSGCAPLLVAGGAAGGYAVAKHVDEEKAEKNHQ